MKTKIEWAELHAPLFLAGTNLGMKLDPAKRSGLTLEYDETTRHLYATLVTTAVTKTARIPESSVLSMVEAPMAGLQAIVNMEPDGGWRAPTPFNPHAAQVSTPISHVHAGPGHGSTGQEPPKRGPGRPPKL